MIFVPPVRVARIARKHPLTIASLVPAVLSFVLLAAHGYRAGLPWVAPVCLVLAVVACVPRRWAATVAQVALMLGALEWVRTLFAFAGARVAQGRPVLRLALILGAVIAFTLLSAWLLRTGAARRWYERTPAAAA
jgi:hypothetical protein